jgi:hypothetical protein
MITERSQAGFDRLLVSALERGLPGGAGGVSIEPVAALDGIGHTRIVVLTVSSYLFRLMAILYFTPDAATRACFARAAGASAPELADEAFHDRVAECGNVCCGTLNRELARHFPHVGMSTPNIIDRDCMRYVDLLGCGLMRHYRLALADGPTMHASLCVADFGLVDFHADASVDEDVSAGELEMF